LYYQEIQCLLGSLLPGIFTIGDVRLPREKSNGGESRYKAKNAGMENLTEASALISVKRPSNRYSSAL
jgi:hypothetical protein